MVGWCSPLCQRHRQQRPFSCRNSRRHSDLEHCPSSCVYYNLELCRARCFCHRQQQQPTSSPTRQTQPLYFYDQQQQHRFLLGAFRHQHLGHRCCCLCQQERQTSLGHRSSTLIAHTYNRSVKAEVTALTVGGGAKRGGRTPLFPFLVLLLSTVAAKTMATVTEFTETNTLSAALTAANGSKLIINPLPPPPPPPPPPIVENHKRLHAKEHSPNEKYGSCDYLTWGDLRNNNVTTLPNISSLYLKYVDNEIHRIYKDFLCVINRTSCVKAPNVGTLDAYSVSTECKACMRSYRNWLYTSELYDATTIRMNKTNRNTTLLLIMKIFDLTENKMEQVESIFDELSTNIRHFPRCTCFCHLAARSCPSLQPSDPHSGQPLFICPITADGNSESDQQMQGNRNDRNSFHHHQQQQQQQQQIRSTLKLGETTTNSECLMKCDYVETLIKQDMSADREGKKRRMVTRRRRSKCDDHPLSPSTKNPIAAIAITIALAALVCCGQVQRFRLHRKRHRRRLCKNRPQ
ncbi:hypothetical protein ACOME3_009579 [Neoechinorhynchus agilis]